MSSQFFSRLLLATTALSAAFAGPGVFGAVARPLPGTYMDVAAGLTSPPGDPSDWRIALGGPALAQLDERQLRRRERDNPGERPGNRPERRDDFRQERQRDQQRQLQEQQERQRNQERQQEQRQQQQERQQRQDLR